MTPPHVSFSHMWKTCVKNMCKQKECKIGTKNICPKCVWQLCVQNVYEKHMSKMFVKNVCKNMCENMCKNMQGLFTCGNTCKGLFICELSRHMNSRLHIFTHMNSPPHMNSALQVFHVNSHVCTLLLKPPKRRPKNHIGMLDEPPTSTKTTNQVT